MGAQKSVCKIHGGHRSKLEHAVCFMLQMRERAGEITDLRSEVHMRVCGPPGHECTSASKVEYIVDFAYLENGKEAFCEAKGFETPVYRMKRRLWIHNDLGRLEVWGGSWQRPRLIETLGG